MASGTRPDLDPNVLVESTDEQLDAIFRESDTLPLETFVNTGEHRIDLDAQGIFNDEHWKGYLPKGLSIRDIMSRLATGYAKRFWIDRKRYLGETLYVQGRIRLKHALEPLEIDRPTNDLEPGRYVLLRYTDPVFEHVFYDVMRALNDGVIVYRGYTGRFPEGKRGFTGLLMRRYSFPQLGVKDHNRLVEMGTAPVRSSLEGTWRLSAIDTANHAVEIGQLSFEPEPGGRLRSAYQPDESGQSLLTPPLIAEHFALDEASALEQELRTIDASFVVGRWTTPIKGPFGKLLLGGSRGLFHAEGKGSARRFTMHYVLRRQPA